MLKAKNTEVIVAKDLGSTPVVVGELGEISLGMAGGGFLMNVNHNGKHVIRRMSELSFIK